MRRMVGGFLLLLSGCASAPPSTPGPAAEAVLPVVGATLEGAVRIAPRTEQFVQYTLREGRRHPSSLLTRTIEADENGGEAVLRVVQRYESGSGVSVDTSIVLRRTLAPLTYRARLASGRTERFDFTPGRMVGTIAPADSAARSVEVALEGPVFSAVLLEEVLQSLPLDSGYAVRLRAYNPGKQTFTLAFRVVGSERLRLPGGQVLDAWVVTDEGGAAPTTRWIAKRTRETVQLRTLLPGGGEFWRVRLLSAPGPEPVQAP